MTKIYQEKNGYVVLDVNPINGFFTVSLKTESGNLLDKISCDTKEDAMDYVKSFKKIAKTF